MRHSFETAVRNDVVEPIEFLLRPISIVQSSAIVSRSRLMEYLPIDWGVMLKDTASLRIARGNF
jgi:hypothetical protein